MKRITSISIIILLFLTVISTNTNGLEKNYRWIKIPVYGGVISSISQGSNNQLYCSTMGDGIYSLGDDHWEPIDTFCSGMERCCVLWDRSVSLCETIVRGLEKSIQSIIE